MPKNCEWFRFKHSIIPYYKKSNLVIAAGGAGTTFEVLREHKKLISIENPGVMGGHQKELLKKLSKDNYLMWCKDVKLLNQTLINSKRFKFKKYKLPKSNIHKKIEEFLVQNGK